MIQFLPVNCSFSESSISLQYSCKVSFVDRYGINKKMVNITWLSVWEFERINCFSLFLHLQTHHSAKLYNSLLRHNCIYLSSNFLDEKVELSKVFIMIQNCILAHHLKNLHNSSLRSFRNIMQSQ